MKPEGKTRYPQLVCSSMGPMSPHEPSTGRLLGLDGEWYGNSTSESKVE